MNLAAILTLAAVSQGVSPDLLKAVCWVETRWQPGAIHKDDGKGSSIGLCQIKLATAQTYFPSAKEADLYDATKNARMAAKILAHHLHYYFGHRACALTAYNRGISGTARLVGLPLLDIRQGKCNTGYSQKVQKALRSKPWMAQGPLNYLSPQLISSSSTKKHSLPSKISRTKLTRTISALP